MSNLRNTDESAGPADNNDEAGFGKYRLLAQLGQGGMADVFLALARGALGVNKLVVIKRLRAGLDRDRDLVTMFLDEARLAVRLNHPNVVHTYEAGEGNGQCFLVMEYLDGLAVDEFLLRARSSGESVPLGVWLRVAIDALAGLHHAHELCDYDGTPLQITHRDVSPQNIFVTYDGITKVVDFGIAKARLSSTVTDAGELKGKACYMAPEHVLGRPSDRRVDVFAMGVLLWELLAGGRRLFKGDAGQALQNVLHAPIPPLSSVVPGTPPALDAIVMRALERDPDERYQSADEMRRDLESFMMSGDLYVGSEGVSRALARVSGDQRERVRQRVRAFMEEQAGPMPSGQERSFIGGQQVIARLSSMRMGGVLPLLMTPSGTVMVAGHSPSRPVVEPARSGSLRKGVRRAGYALVALSLLVFGVGGGLLMVRSQRPDAAASAVRAASAAARAPSPGATSGEGAAPASRPPAAPKGEALPGASSGGEASPAARAAPPPRVVKKRPPSAGPGGAPSSAPAAPSLAPPKPEAARPKVKLVDEQKRSLRLDE